MKKVRYNTVEALSEALSKADNAIEVYDAFNAATVATLKSYAKEEGYYMSNFTKAKKAEIISLLMDEVQEILSANAEQAVEVEAKSEGYQLAQEMGRKWNYSTESEISGPEFKDFPSEYTKESEKAQIVDHNMHEAGNCKSEAELKAYFMKCKNVATLQEMIYRHYGSMPVIMGSNVEIWAEWFTKELWSELTEMKLRREDELNEAESAKTCAEVGEYMYDLLENCETEKEVYEVCAKAGADYLRCLLSAEDEDFDESAEYTQKELAEMYTKIVMVGKYQSRHCMPEKIVCAM